MVGHTLIQITPPIIYKGTYMRSFMQKHWPLIQEMSTESLWEVYCIASYKVYGKLPTYITKMQRKELITHIKMLHNTIKTKSRVI